MIVQTGIVAKVSHWEKRKDNILTGMRGQIATAAERRNLLLGNETVEIVHMLQAPDGTWLSAHPENATHVRVTVETEASHDDPSH